jgi:protease IV
MPIDAEQMSERRRLTRRLSFWRIAAIAAACLTVIGIAVATLSRSSLIPGASHVARVTISGIITGDKPTLRLLEEVGRSPASAVIVVIDSPGGTVPGSEMIYDELRRLNQRKPVVTVVNTLAASGGYIAALGTERIVARQTALVGSIGVLFQVPNVSALLDKVGVKVETVRSTPLKAMPSGIEPTSPEAKAAVEELVGENYTWFRTLVKDRRNLSDAQIVLAADGRVFSGRRAKEIGLVDDVGGEREARAWLETAKDISRDLPIRDYKKRRTLEESGLLGMTSSVLGWLGLESSVAALDRFSQKGEALSLDGLLALWQPAP